MYTIERPIEVNQSLKYYGFPGVIEKESFIVGRKPNRASINKLAEAVLSFYGFNLNTVLIPSRKTIKVRAKYMTYYILFERYKFNKSELGRLFEVNHSTIINGVNSVKEQLSINTYVYVSELNQILQQLMNVSH
jgi:chromosomal replication initiation ATPase DnaA